MIAVPLTDTISEYVLIDSDEDNSINELPLKAKSKPSSDNFIEDLDLVDSTKWYSITVENAGKHSKSLIFDAILHKITPCEFVPVLIEKGHILKKFYVTKCERAIKMISLLGFQFFCENDKNAFNLKVVHNDPPQKIINPFKLIHDVIKSCFNMGNNELNLSNFQESREFLDVIYFPLWYPGNQKIVNLLIKALSLTPYIQILNISDNNLESLSGFDISNCFNVIHSLNLSNNLLGDFKVLRDFLNISDNITELWLDGNDMCLNFIQEQHYINCVKSIFPKINKLDGKVFKQNGLPITQRNFVIDRSAITLVNKFMEVYFTLFDSDERDLLSEMYSNKAIFNIACQRTFGSNFHKRSRNILQCKQKGLGGNVFVGSRGIIGCLGFLPKTEHDPLTFTVDITGHSDTCTVFSITGVFKMPSVVLSQDEPMYEFMRTFIIIKINENCQYKITNDFLNISSHQSSRAKDAFATTVTVKDKLSLKTMNPSLLERPVMDGMVDLFIVLTQMPYTEAKKILERNRWNFRAALVDTINILQKE